MKKLIILFLFIIPALGQSQNIQDGAGLITIEELQDHMYFLASDSLKGRYPGTRGYNIAAEYGASQFKQAGLLPFATEANGEKTYLQPVPFEIFEWDKNNKITFSQKSKISSFNIAEHFVMLSKGDIDITELEGELVFVSAGIREPEYGMDNYEGIDAKGKWVVMYNDIDTLKSILPGDVYYKYNKRGSREKFVVESGALGAIILPSKGMMKYWPGFSAYYSKKTSLKGEKSSNIISLMVDTFLVAALFENSRINPWNEGFVKKSFPIKKATLKLSKKYFLKEFTSYNVVGMLPGTEPNLKNEYITIGGHLDHVGMRNGLVINGADDNASGSIAVIEIAESAAKIKTKRPVIFMLYTAEEMGLLGSTYFTENPVVPLNQIMVNINLDMIGRDDGDVKNGIAPINADNISNKLKDKILDVHKKYPVVELDWPYADTTRYYTLSDHYPFHKKEIPAVFFFNGTHPDYHRPADDAEKIDYEYYQKNCWFVYYLLMELANSEELILK